MNDDKTVDEARGSLASERSEDGRILQGVEPSLGEGSEKRAGKPGNSRNEAIENEAIGEARNEVLRGGEHEAKARSRRRRHGELQGMVKWAAEREMVKRRGQRSSYGVQGWISSLQRTNLLL